ncbi:hypothetical protein [Thiohalophilus thiocyanatoxydans]|uniref:Uncharacterized protein n=1 Tax=Thiohalophilus thiocyanatoxydans TaxID=381308 RepID=A0A4R8IRM9_9GAMM|nr:hypothetical protein [Thiohalophilus thiocyanatoxydans]TDY03004.1 hypothetical protein EDC23_1388 [Thiohalophilus thiocyanatoxydans]
MSWLSENGLALYGSVTGTAALLITFFSHRHNVKKDQIKLSVSYAGHQNKSKNIELLNTDNSENTWDKPNLVEVYTVTVRNLGSISAPLHDVGVMDKDGKKHQALVNHQMSHFLQSLSESHSETLEPRAAKTFSVYLRRGESVFLPVLAYAIDQTGKEWKCRA